MRFIKLTRGQVALVDDDDFERVSACNWYCSTWGYGVRHISHLTGIRNKLQYLHRFIMGEPPGLQVDHVNMDRLDCRKANLRITTKLGNNLNRPAFSHNKLGIKGVHWDERRKKFAASICIRGKETWLGYHTEAASAKAAYAAAAKTLHGEFARTE